MFKVLQHIKAKSYKLRMNLVDFGGTAESRTAGLFSMRGHVNVRTDGKPYPFHNRRHLIFWNGTTLSNFAH